MSEEGKNNNSDQSTSVTTRRKKATTRMEETEEKPNRPTSLELKTDRTNTETKLIILDFLSSQSIEHLTARNAPGGGRKSSSGKVCKSASDGSSHEPSYRKRSAKLANYARPLRKQYSFRLRNDLDEYLKLKQRGKSLEELPSHENGEVAREEATYTHQRSFTEGDAYFKRSRTISNELKKGITEFSSNSIPYPHTSFTAFYIESMYNKTNIKTILHGGFEDMNFIFEW